MKINPLDLSTPGLQTSVVLMPTETIRLRQKDEAIGHTDTIFLSVDDLNKLFQWAKENRIIQ